MKVTREILEMSRHLLKREGCVCVCGVLHACVVVYVWCVCVCVVCCMRVWWCMCGVCHVCGVLRVW